MYFLDKKDPQIAEILQRLKKMNELLDKNGSRPQPMFKSDYYMTAEELAKVLKVSRRTLQEYRSARMIPYYIVQGKALYKESEIRKILEDSHKRCVEEQRWV